MKNSYAACVAILASFSIPFLTGCQPRHPWHMNAHKEGDSVQICLSNEAKCPQAQGVSPGAISVYRYTSTFDNEIVWEAWPQNPINDTISGVLTFGVPPQNWSNKRTPPKVECGKAYLVNPGDHFFALKCDGSVVVFDFPQLEAFFRQDAAPAPAKPGGY